MRITLAEALLDENLRRIVLLHLSGLASHSCGRFDSDRTKGRRVRFPQVHYSIHWIGHTNPRIENMVTAYVCEISRVNPYLYETSGTVDGKHLENLS